VARTDVAVTAPPAPVVPWTTTVSPVCRPARLDFEVRVTVTDGPTVTFTRFPLASVT
jgi:hypothetical protein